MGMLQELRPGVLENCKWYKRRLWKFRKHRGPLLQNSLVLRVQPDQDRNPDYLRGSARRWQNLEQAMEVPGKLNDEPDTAGTRQQTRNQFFPSAGHENSPQTQNAMLRHVPELRE